MSVQAATAEQINSLLVNGMAIHTKLDEILESRGKSLYWLQQQTGVSYTALLKLRKDRARSIDYEVLDKVCGALDCEPGELIVRVKSSDEGKAKKAK